MDHVNKSALIAKRIAAVSAANPNGHLNGEAMEVNDTHLEGAIRPLLPGAKIEVGAPNSENTQLVSITYDPSTASKYAKRANLIPLITNAFREVVDGSVIAAGSPTPVPADTKSGEQPQKPRGSITLYVTGKTPVHELDTSRLGEILMSTARASHEENETIERQPVTHHTSKGIPSNPGVTYRG